MVVEQAMDKTRYIIYYLYCAPFEFIDSSLTLRLYKIFNICIALAAKIKLFDNNELIFSKKVIRMSVGFR